MQVSSEVMFKKEYQNKCDLCEKDIQARIFFMPVKIKQDIERKFHYFCKNCWEKVLSGKKD